MIIQDVVNSLYSTLVSSERFINREDNIGDFFLIAATLDKKNHIIDIGENNKYKTHPRMFYYSNRINPKKIFLHAEISALIRSPYKQAHTLVVIRVNRAGELAMARPCPVCQLAILDSGIKEVYYSNNEGEILYCGGGSMFEL